MSRSRKQQRPRHANDTGPTAKEVVAKQLAEIKARRQPTADDVSRIGMAAMFQVKRLRLGRTTSTECLQGIITEIDREVGHG